MDSKGIERVFTPLEKLDLRGAVYKNSELDFVDFVRADLRDARFERVTLTGCDFSGADLRGATFIGCDLRSAIFHGAMLERNRFDGTLLAGVVGVDECKAEIQRSGGVFTPACASYR